jgi:Zn-dependent M16 (insulinase) family peptidase
VRHLQARQVQIGRVRAALAELKNDARRKDEAPSDLTTEELTEIEKIMRLAAVQWDEMERLSGLYESALIRISTAEQKIERLTETIERMTGTSDRK